jgi:hypothetical protein
MPKPVKLTGDTKFIFKAVSAGRSGFFIWHLKKFQISLVTGGARGAKNQAVRP